MSNITPVRERPQMAFFKVLRGDLLKYIVSFQKGRAFKDWIDGDLSAELGYMDILQHNKNLLYTERAIDSAKTFEIARFLHQKGLPFTEQAMEYAAEIGDLPRLQYFHEHNFPCTEKVMDLAAASDDFQIMLWLHKNYHEGCSQDALCKAVGAANFQAIHWLQTNYPEVVAINDLNNNNIFNHAAGNGKVPILKWAVESLRITDDLVLEGLELACSQGDLPAVQYLWTRLTGEIDTGIGIHLMNNAAMGNNLELIQWLCSKGLEFTHQTLSIAANSENFKSLKYLMEKNRDWPADLIDLVVDANETCRDDGNEIFFTVYSLTNFKTLSLTCEAQKLLNLAIMRGNLPIVKFLIEEEKYPVDDEAFGNAIESGSFRMVKFIAKKCANLEASDQHVHTAVSNDSLDIVKWLFANNLGVWSEKIFKRAILHQNLSLLNWWKEKFTSEFEKVKKIVFDQALSNIFENVKKIVSDRTLSDTSIYNFNNLAGRSSLEVILWLDQEGYDKETFQIAFRYSNRLVSEWFLDKNKFVPDAILDAAQNNWYSYVVKIHQLFHSKEDHKFCNHGIIAASANGNMSIVQYLYENCIKNWPTNAETIKRMHSIANLNHHSALANWIKYQTEMIF